MSLFLSRINRRKFLIGLGTAAGVALVSILFVERSNILSPTNTTFTHPTTISSQTTASTLVTSSSKSEKSPFPTGNRVVRIRVLNDDQSWVNAMGSYTTDTVLGWINDLKPTTLNRYFSGPQNSSQTLPGSANYTVQEFMQASVSACENPNNTTMFPRLSFDYYKQSPSTLLSNAQQMYDMCSNLDPPQTLLSIDDYNENGTDLSSSSALALADELFNQGWTGLCWGAGGATGPEGYATFAMVIPTKGTNWHPPWSHMQSLQQIGGYSEFEAQIDFPSDMQTLVGNYTPDQMAQIFATLAEEQNNNSSLNGLGENFPYHYMYPIYQGESPDGSGATNSTFHWDSTQYTCQNAPYAGMTLYEVMKQLLNTYNV